MSGSGLEELQVHVKRIEEQKEMSPDGIPMGTFKELDEETILNIILSRRLEQGVP